MKRLIIILTIAFLAAFHSNTASAQYKIVNYTDMNQINSLTEDGDYIWVSTSGGAFKRKKSDGSLVKVINTDNSGISRNSVNTMFIDFFGNYWFGTQNGGISKFDGNTWTNYTYLDNTWVNYCEAITSDLNGDLWFGVNGGVLRYKNNEWKYFGFGPYRSVGSIVADDMGTIWASIAGINGAGLWKIDATEKIEKVSGPGNYFDVTSAPYCLHKDNNNNIWMGTWDGLFRYNNNTGVWTDFTSSVPTINSMSQDNLGNIWMGTEIGIMKYDGASFGPIIGSGRSGSYDDMVMDVMSDSQGKVWLGSYKGLSQLNQATNSWTTPILLNALPTNHVETLVFDSNNKAFVWGQFDNTLKFDGSFWSSVSNNSATSFYWMRSSAIDNADNKFTAMPGADKRLRVFKLNSSNNTSVYSHTDDLTYAYASDVVQDLKYDVATDRVWIATNQGLFSCKSNGTFWIRFVQTPGGLTSNNVTGVAINGTKVWFSTGDNGIGYYDQSNSSWHSYTQTEGLPWNTAGKMVFDQQNNLWVVCSGLTKFDGSIFQNWYPGINASTIACDLNGNIWIGGSGGAAKFNNGKFRKYSTTDGLIEDDVRGIVIDRTNNVWLTTGFNGMSKLVPQTPVADFSTNTVCLPGSTVLTNQSTKTDELTSYAWDINNDGSIEFTSRDAEFEFPSKGNYTVKLTVMNDDLSTEVIKQVVVLEAPNVSLNLEGDHSVCSGESQDLQVIINNQDPLLQYQVAWNNGITGTQEIWVSEGGEYYATIDNGECQAHSPSINLAISQPFANEKICMVTVDVSSGKNMIVWERTHNSGISSYNVYKLFGNTYVPVGNVSVADISQYIDYTSAPDALAARYAISSIDTCGNESEKSAYHQTIQLGAAAGIKPNTVVLDWTNYIDESKIWQPEYYFIYRGTDPLKLTLIDSVSSVFTEWNDNNPGDSRYYQVLIRKSHPCDPAELLGKKASSGPYVHSLSNLEDNRLQSTGISSINALNALSVFPNPLKTESTIRWKNPTNSSYELKLFDVRGSLVKHVTDIRSGEYKLLREGLQQGVYIIELQGDKLFKSRLIVE